MKMFKILTLLFFVTLFNSTVLSAFELISKTEHAKFLGNRSDKPNNILFRSLSNKTENLPDIKILQPQLGEEIVSPTNIEITFKAKNNATIDIASLKFLYGWLGFDITDRIKKNSKITVTGLSANNVTLPKGEHVIRVKISDNEGRSAEKEIEFIVK